MRDKNKIWLSHTGLEILERCPRCFWLKYNKGISDPEWIVSRLPDRFDRIIKEYFDRFRKQGELPPLVKGKVEGKLENPFQEKYFYSIDEKYSFYGKLDDCLVSEDGFYIPVEFKTASADPRGKEIFPSYQNQMDEYTFLLEMNQKKTPGFSYIIYFYPDQGEEIHRGMPIIVDIQKVKTNPNLVKPRLIQAIEILEKDLPLPKNGCPFCQWYDKLTKIFDGINFIKGRDVEEVKETFKMPDSIYSKTLQAGGKTYFFDLKEAQSSDRYLQITESRLKQGGERYRSNIVIFKEHLNEFRQALDEIAEKL